MKKSKQIRKEAKEIKDKKVLYKMLSDLCFVSEQHIEKRWFNGQLNYKIDEKYHKTILFVIDKLIEEKK